VLTEPHRFDGSLADLEAVAAALDVPAMRKDFLVDPYQVFEARACGAGGVLLIVRMLDDGRMREMLDVADALGMWVLLEAFGGDDLTRATSQVDGRANVLVGLNSRNLRTLEVDIDRFEQLAGAFPAGVPRVAESGLVSPGDAARVAEAGYGLALVGTALMRSGAPQEAARAMIAAGRAVVS
jgi:indole-3-glycerol phosphate synthase